MTDTFVESVYKPSEYCLLGWIISKKNKPKFIAYIEQVKNNETTIFETIVRNG